MASPFAVLGLDPGDDEEAIERAYRRRVKEAHPDHGGSVAEFVAVREAYAQLKAGQPAMEPATDGSSNGAGGRTGAATSDPTDGAAAEAAPSSEPLATSTVTYLNYDVLDDYGWGPRDDDLFEKAADAGLGEPDFGQFEVRPGMSVLEGAEASGCMWPFACRGGACANCAILLRDGELSMPVNHVLPTDMMEQDVRLTCNGMPITAELDIVYNVKHMPELEDLLLPPRPFEQTYPSD